MDHDEQDRRVRVEGDPLVAAPVLRALRVHIGWPTLRISQDEALRVEEAIEGRVRFVYTFDHDFASQYDQTETWEGCVSLEPLRVVAWARR